MLSMRHSPLFGLLESRLQSLLVILILQLCSIALEFVACSGLDVPNCGGGRELPFGGRCSQLATYTIIASIAFRLLHICIRNTSLSCASYFFEPVESTVFPDKHDESLTKEVSL